jgi:thiol:disulfide interchange protein DsbC
MNAARRAQLAMMFACVLGVAPMLAAADDPELEKLRDELAQRLPEVKREDVRRTAAPGLFQVRRGDTYGYVTADGNYLVIGDLVELGSGSKLSEIERRGMRLAAMEKLAPTVLTFGPPEKKRKHVVYVIADVDCPYCAELHRDIKGFNERGIELRYVFYPRRGPGSESFLLAQQIWCAADRHLAFTQVLAGKKLKAPHTDCGGDPVLLHYETAADAGLRETPLLVMPDGSVFRGVISPSALLARLEALAAPPIAGH